MQYHSFWMKNFVHRLREVLPLPSTSKHSCSDLEKLVVKQKRCSPDKQFPSVIASLQLCYYMPGSFIKPCAFGRFSFRASVAYMVVIMYEAIDLGEDQCL